MVGCGQGKRGPSVAAGTWNQLEAWPPNQMSLSREKSRGLGVFYFSLICSKHPGPQRLKEYRKIRRAPSTGLERGLCLVGFYLGLSKLAHC